MAKRIQIKTRRAMQWKTLRGVHIEGLAKNCEEWTAKGWTVFTILGPLGNLSIVLSRMITL